MDLSRLNPRLHLLQDADLKDKVVLIRVDHNVVKKGIIKDPFRIDRTIGTMFYVVAQGGKPILMTHVGRPRDKKTGSITVDEGSTVQPIVDYIFSKLHIGLHIPSFPPSGDRGISAIDTSINHAIKDLKSGEINGIYLPNTRWFTGEESSGEIRQNLALQLAGLADVFVNDAFGSWQPHASTCDVAAHLPSYAGFLMQAEIVNLDKVLKPQRPFLAVVAGAKYDTKIGPLNALYEQVDHLILGGVIYNTYLCAKYGISIQGVPESDIQAAKRLVEMDAAAGKIVELPILVESGILGREEGNYRVRDLMELKPGDALGYVLDIDGAAFEDSRVQEAILGARTIFVNAVMGFTPLFTDGSRALDTTIDKNLSAMKLYGGGDTLQEFKDLNPGLYLSVQDDANYYFFTGGGTVLKAIQEKSPYGLGPVKALLE